MLGCLDARGKASFLAAAGVVQEAHCKGPVAAQDRLTGAVLRVVIHNQDFVGWVD